MSSYAQISDLGKYTTLTLRTADADLQTLMDNSERDIDRLFNPRTLTDSLQGFSMVNVTGGNWVIALDWLDTVYTTDPIPWNVTSDVMLELLNGMYSALGKTINSPAWMIPVTPELAPDWASGPLPFSPLVVQATGYLGGQILPPLVASSIDIQGGSPQINVTQFRGGGTRLDIWQLEPFQVKQLANATCAQAEYRDQMGEDFFAKAQWDSVSGPEFRTTGKLPILGPKVHRELLGSGLVQYSGRASVGSRGSNAAVMARLGGTTIPDDWRAV